MFGKKKSEIKKVLILFGHPAFKRSTINSALRVAVKTLDGVTFHDLYASYGIVFPSIKAIVFQRPAR